MADFDTLIELITSTIAPDTWDAVGGPGAIESFPTNLSLVISQTQDVHDQIADLLAQLRRLQDLQVTIEVRFITLRDDFFERIGVDFDFNIDDNVTELPRDDAGPRTVIGLDPLGQPTPDFDLEFTQSTLRQRRAGVRGNATDAASFGFAILSDIEVFFLLQRRRRRSAQQCAAGPQGHAVQRPVGLRQRHLATALRHQPDPRRGRFRRRSPAGDRRAQRRNVPQRAGRRLVGPPLRAADPGAVLQPDRRRGRIHLHRQDQHQGFLERRRPRREAVNENNKETVTEGTTVQLPTFSFTTVSTTVSVPDGGTVLLGGIKRLREGRNEAGVPMLSKVPYVNRLFKNVGIGRETQSLMLMVTPRIIIQEEEESKLGIEMP